MYIKYQGTKEGAGMKRKNLIYILGKHKQVDKNVNTLSEENNDPDIWLGMLERDIVTIEYNKRDELDLDKDEKQTDSSKKTRNYISKAITRIAMPAIATVVAISLGLLPELNGVDDLNVFEELEAPEEVIAADIDENIPVDNIFKCRVVDNTKKIEINNLAITRTDNNKKVQASKIAPGTSGEFMIEIDATRNAGSSRI